MLVLVVAVVVVVAVVAVVTLVVVVALVVVVVVTVVVAKNILSWNIENTCSRSYTRKGLYSLEVFRIT